MSVKRHKNSKSLDAPRGETGVKSKNEAISRLNEFKEQISKIIEEHEAAARKPCLGSSMISLRQGKK